MNVTQIMEQYQTILEQEVPQLARETGAVKRVRKQGLDAVTLVSSVIFGFWQNPELTLGGLAQVARRREVQVSESAISQRFTPQCAELFLRVLKRLVSIPLQEEKVEIPLLKQFSAVIVEDSSTVNAAWRNWPNSGEDVGSRPRSTQQPSSSLCAGMCFPEG